MNILIIKGGSSGRKAKLVYSFYRHPSGYYQMEETSMDGYEEIFWAVPIFDHCGAPMIVELKKDEFVEMTQ